MIDVRLLAPLAAVLIAASGCTAARVAGSVTGATVGVAGKAAKTTVGVTGKTAGAAIDVATPDGEKKTSGDDGEAPADAEADDAGAADRD